MPFKQIGSPTDSSSILTNSLSELGVPFHLPSSPSYAALSQSYNLVFSFSPVAILLPDNDQAVSHAIKFARERGFKVQAKSGGHSYGAYSTGGRDGSLVINLRSFQDVVVDKSTGIAQVGSGVRLGTLATKLYAHGSRALPHGIIPGVGVGGHFTHGGYGYHCRAWGLALDTIVGLDVALADGSAVHASAEENPEIFFALRGAADSFGVITRFYLQTITAPEKVVLFCFNIYNLLVDIAGVTDKFLHLQCLALNPSFVDRDLTFGIYIHDEIFTIWGVYLKDETEFTRKIAPALLEGINTVVDETVQTMGWLEHLAWFAGQTFNSVSETASDAFYAKSAVIPEMCPLSEETAYRYFDFMRTGRIEKSQAWYSIINLYGGPDSQINTRDTESASYAHRDALWVVQHFAYSKSHKPPLLPSTISFITQLTESLIDLSSQDALGIEANYVDPLLSRQTANELCYGQSILRRLERLKRVLDPDEVFWNPQSIAPYSLEDCTVDGAVRMIEEGAIGDASSGVGDSYNM